MMSKIVPIRIRKHTPVRRPMSYWEIIVSDTGSKSANYPQPVIVTDLTRKRQTVSKVPKYDWTEGTWADKQKETLWQKVKRYYKEGLTE